MIQAILLIVSAFAQEMDESVYNQIWYSRFRINEHKSFVDSPDLFERILDHDNLFETGYLRPIPVKYGGVIPELLREKYSKLDFKHLMLMNHEVLVSQQNWSKSYINSALYPNQISLPVFFINGNCGSHEQFPLIANSLEKYFNQLVEL